MGFGERGESERRTAALELDERGLGLVEERGERRKRSHGTQEISAECNAECVFWRVERGEIEQNFSTHVAG